MAAKMSACKQSKLYSNIFIFFADKFVFKAKVTWNTIDLMYLSIFLSENISNKVKISIDSTENEEEETQESLP